VYGVIPYIHDKYPWGWNEKNCAPSVAPDLYPRTLNSDENYIRV